MKVFENLDIKECLHDKTQNEGVNASIWKFCPKDIYAGLTVLKIGRVSAMINFNDAICWNV